MDNYIVSARKYRPATFRSVIGQEALTTTLRNAIASNKLAHAYLFCGPRGVGKTTCARIFAKTINCQNITDDYEACNNCESCVAFNQQRSYNIHELDAASNNSVDDIRSLIDQVRIPPQIGKYKVYIIDEVHMLSTAAFNSFLKTLEEPPTHAIFILATTEKHKIIPTILSRCQVYDFNRITISDTVRHLQYVAEAEGVKAEPEALNIIAQKSDGGMRDALSIFDQTVSFTGGNVTYKSVIENLNVLDYEYYFKITDAILAGSVVDALLALNDILNRGFEGQYIISGITSHFRDLLVCKDPATAQLFEVGASIRERYISTAQQCSNLFLYKSIEISNDCDLNYRLSKNKRLLLEITLIKLCQLTENPIELQKETLQKKNEIKPLTPANNKTYQQNIQEESKPDTNENVKPKKESQPPKKFGMGVSLSSLANQELQSSNEQFIHKNEVRQLDKQLNETDLIKVWASFAKGLQDEIILKNTMEKITPRIIDNTTFAVEVNTELNKEYLNNSNLLSFVRNELGNEHINMIVNVSENTTVYRPTTPREVFADMVKQNPTLQELSDEFSLELT